MLLAQFIFAHSIGFAICKIVVVRITNAHTHGVRIANPHGRIHKSLELLLFERFHYYFLGNSPIVDL